MKLKIQRKKSEINEHKKVCLLLILPSSPINILADYPIDFLAYIFYIYIFDRAGSIMGSLCDLMWDIDNNRERNLHNELFKSPHKLRMNKQGERGRRNKTLNRKSRRLTINSLVRRSEKNSSAWFHSQQAWDSNPTLKCTLTSISQK